MPGTSQTRLNVSSRLCFWLLRLHHRCLRRVRLACRSRRWLCSGISIIRGHIWLWRFDDGSSDSIFFALEHVFVRESQCSSDMLPNTMEGKEKQTECTRIWKRWSFNSAKGKNSVDLFFCHLLNRQSCSKCSEVKLLQWWQALIKMCASLWRTDQKSLRHNAHFVHRLRTILGNTVFNEDSSRVVYDLKHYQQKQFSSCRCLCDV